MAIATAANFSFSDKTLNMEISSLKTFYLLLPVQSTIDKISVLPRLP